MSKWAEKKVTWHLSSHYLQNLSIFTNKKVLFLKKICGMLVFETLKNKKSDFLNSNTCFCSRLYVSVSVTSLLEDSTEESGFMKDFWEWPKPFLNQDSFLFQTQRNPWKVIKWWNGMKTDFKIPFKGLTCK